MSKALRASLIIGGVAVVIITVWILFRDPLQNKPTGDDIRTFNSIPPFPVTISTMELGADGPAAGMEETKQSHIDIEGETPDPTFTSEPEPAVLSRPLSTAVCRTGPSTCCPPVAYLTQNQLLPTDGRTHDDAWLRLVLLPSDMSCWVWAEMLSVDGDLDIVPQIQPAPWPCAGACQQEPTQSPPGCWIVDGQHPNGFCRPGACTPNDFPGTNCTPP